MKFIKDLKEKYKSYNKTFVNIRLPFRSTIYLDST